MSDPVVSVDDFALYLNNPDLDEDRAVFIIGLAQQLCESIVTPLPTGAATVVLDVAERAFANPTDMRGASPGLYSEGEGPFSDSTPGSAGGGLWLTTENKATLRRLAGGGGAFTIDTIPADFVPVLPPWDAGNWAFG